MSSNRLNFLLILNTHQWQSLQILILFDKHFSGLLYKVELTRLDYSYIFKVNDFPVMPRAIHFRWVYLVLVCLYELLYYSLTKKTRCNNFATAPILTVQNCLATLFVWEIMFPIKRGRLHIGLFHFSIRFFHLHLRMSQTNKGTVLLCPAEPATGKYYFVHCLHGLSFGP